jgi:hypothetical protein
MRTRSEPSFSSTAQPRPLTGSHSSLPSQENSTPGRPSRSISRQSISPWTAMKPKRPDPSLANSMNAGATRFRASQSHRSASVIRHLPAMRILAPPDPRPLPVGRLMLSAGTFLATPGSSYSRPRMRKPWYWSKSS